MTDFTLATNFIEQFENFASLASLGISPDVAAVIGAMIVGIRAVTNTPIGSKSH